MGVEMSLPSNETKKLRCVLLGAVAFGVAVGLAIGVGTEPAAPRLDPIAEGFDAGETMLHAGPANHFKALLVHLMDGRRDGSVGGARDVWIARLGEAVNALRRQTSNGAPDLTA